MSQPTTYALTSSSKGPSKKEKQMHTGSAKSVNISSSPGIAHSTMYINDLKKHDAVSVTDVTNRLICGDAIEAMRLLPSESIDLIATSPPYNLKNSTGNGMKDGRGGKWSNAALLNGYVDHGDSMPHDEYVEWQRACLTEMFRLIPDDGVIFYNHKWRVQAGLLQDRNDIVSGFPVRQVIIWRRKGGINFNPGYFLPTYEVIYMITKPKFRLAPKANAYGDVWEFGQEFKNPHPAPFPLELVTRIVASTNADTVLDPFMGSGSTAIAAIAQGRNYVGIELSPEYCYMAEERIHRYTTGESEEGTNDKAQPLTLL